MCMRIVDVVTREVSKGKMRHCELQYACNTAVTTGCLTLALPGATAIHRGSTVGMSRSRTVCRTERREKGIRLVYSHRASLWART